MRNHTGANELRIARSRQRNVVPKESRHTLENLVPLLIIQEAWRRKSCFAAPTVSARIGSPHHHNPVRVFVWKWPEQGRIHHTEDRGVRSNAERERAYCHKSKAGIHHQHSGAIAQVLNERLDKPQTPHLAAYLLQPGLIAE